MIGSRLDAARASLRRLVAAIPDLPAQLGIIRATLTRELQQRGAVGLFGPLAGFAVLGTLAEALILARNGWTARPNNRTSGRNGRRSPACRRLAPALRNKHNRGVHRRQLRGLSRVRLAAAAPGNRAHLPRLLFSRCGSPWSAVASYSLPGPSVSAFCRCRLRPRDTGSSGRQCWSVLFISPRVHFDWCRCSEPRCLPERSSASSSALSCSASRSSQFGGALLSTATRPPNAFTRAVLGWSVPISSGCGSPLLPVRPHRSTSGSFSFRGPRELRSCAVSSNTCCDHREERLLTRRHGRLRCGPPSRPARRAARRRYARCGVHSRPRPDCARSKRYRGHTARTRRSWMSSLSSGCRFRLADDARLDRPSAERDDVERYDG